MQGVPDILLVVSCLLTTSQALSPDGANVCLFDENYTQKVETKEQVPVKVTKVIWCLKMPPRCTVEDTELRWQMVTKEVPRMRVIAKCCAGYAADLSNSLCVPVCSQPCVHGICASPDNCLCESGFNGSQCTKVCLQGSWGRSCVEKCDCVNAQGCGPVHGNCNCLPGWQGPRCAEPCYEGFFGPSCEQKCNCKGDLCNHVTGVCIFPSTTMAVTPSAASMTATESVASTPNQTTLVFTNVWTSTSRKHPTTAMSTEATTPSTVPTPRSSLRPRLRTTTTRPLSTEKRKVKENETTKEDTKRFIVVPEKKGSSTSSSMTSTMLQSLIAVSAVLLAVFLTAMGLLMYSHCKKVRRKAKRLSAREELVVRAIRPEDIGIHKFYGEGVLPVKTVFENPVYCSADCDYTTAGPDVRPQMVLQTFLPVTPPPSETSRGASIADSHYDRPPPSNRTTAEPVDEPFYDEISVAQEYDIPRRYPRGHSSR